MNKLNGKKSTSGSATILDLNPTAGAHNGAPTYIKMESPPEQKPNGPDRDDDDHNDNTNKTPEDAVKEPLTPIPVQDQINPPLSATLGGDDVVIPLDKK